MSEQQVEALGVLCFLGLILIAGICGAIGRMKCMEFIIKTMEDEERSHRDFIEHFRKHSLFMNIKPHEGLDDDKEY